VQPADQTVPTGATATLVVGGEGTPPLAYQWFRGEAGTTSAPLAAGGRVLTTEPLAAAESFWVQVSNACGQVASRTAVIAVSASERVFYLGPDNTVPLVLVRVAAGTSFTMGSPPQERGRNADEGPAHSVTVARDFFLGRYEVTQAQWQAVTGWNPSRFYGEGPEYPVYDVSWIDITRPDGFLERLNRDHGTEKFRLPSEAEWEFAARGGTTTEFSFPLPANWDTECGSVPAADAFMWWCGNSDRHAHPVGLRAPNPIGLYDMHGNVWEWVEDAWHRDYAGDPPTDGGAWLLPLTVTRVLRGGSWGSWAGACRSARRYSYFPNTWGHGVLGFRLAMSE
jgi:formylglycine-generating enzyme required for sulfatase activity